MAKEKIIYGMPYVGSKSRICEKIIKFFPKGKRVYDLFGGGGAVTLCAFNNGYKVHYNELNKDTFGLFKKIVERESNIQYYLKHRVSRKEFEAKKDTDQIIKLCWSFGNGGEGYMYGKDIEEWKRLLFELESKNPKNQEELDKLLNDLSNSRTFGKKGKEYRIYFRWNYNEYAKHEHPRYWLKYRVKERLNLKGEKINQNDIETRNLQNMQSLERIQSLERLERLERLEWLNLTNLDYKKVEIEPGATIYCDPPYEGTEGGKGLYEGGFNHKEFKERCIEKSKTNLVIVSSYEFNVEGFTRIGTKHSSIMSGKGNDKNIEKRECLFIAQPR